MQDVEIEIVGTTGHITLNRPRVLNALTPDMIEAIHAALRNWQSDATVAAVVVDSASERAFCAGGDIRLAATFGRERGADAVATFFAAEYAMDAAVGDFPKPCVALIDGIAMGGGLGLSVHGSHRVVSERAVLAMPETAIGFFPDIGASYFLPRLPHRVGRYMGLCGGRIHGADAVHVGLATHFVPHTRMADLRDALLHATRSVDETLRQFAQTPPPHDSAWAALIEDGFGGQTPYDVLANLERLAGAGHAPARDALTALRAASPSAVARTFTLLERGAHDDLHRCLARELALARAMARQPDFFEGVRASLVDKDHAPRWQPATLEEVHRIRAAGLAFLRGGSGVPLLTVHGNFATRQWFEPLSTDPPAACEVIAPDLPGCGDSVESGIHAPSIAHFADALEAFIRETGLDRPILMGHSMGGAVVTEMAARNPSAYRGLILVSSAPPDGFVTPEAHYENLRRYRTDRALLRAALSSLAAGAPPARLDDLLDDAFHMFPAAFEGHSRALASWSAADRLPQLRTLPRLVLGGEEDAIITAAMVRRTAEQLEAPCHIYPEVGHALPIEAPQVLRDAIQAFLDS